MANYKQLYAQSSRMLDKYQTEVVPNLRARVAELEERMGAAVPVVRCGECIHSFVFTSAAGNSSLLCTEIGRRGLSGDDYCSFGERRKSHA